MRWASATRSGIQVDENDVAYVTDYSPDSRVPQDFRGPAGTGRVMVVRGPSNYGWPLCYRTDLPYYRWDFVTQQPLDDPAQVHECDNPERGPQNTSRWNVEGGPTVEPGSGVRPAGHQPRGLVLVQRQHRRDAARDAVLRRTTTARVPPSCPRLFPELGTGGVGPHGAAKYTYDPSNPDPTKLPPYYDGAIFFGEFTRDTLREIRLDSDGRVFKLNDLFNCGGLTPGQVPQTDNPFECDSPMDMQFDESRPLLPAHLRRRVLQHQQRRRDVPLGLRQGPARSDRGPRRDTDRRRRAADRAVLERRLPRPRSGRLDPLRVGPRRDGSIDSVDPNPQFTYAALGQYTARLTVFDSSGDEPRRTRRSRWATPSPTVVVTTPVEGGLFSFGESIPFSVTVTDPEDGAIDCGGSR